MPSPPADLPADADPADPADGGDPADPTAAEPAVPAGADDTADDEDAAGTGEADEGGGGARPSRPWGRIAALVSLVYVAWYVVGLVVLRRDASSYNALNRFYGGVVPRVLLCLVLLALLFHLLDGLRVTAEDALPRLLRHDVVLRTGVRFVLLAAWIPASTAVLWPAIKTWFSR